MATPDYRAARLAYAHAPNNNECVYTHVCVVYRANVSSSLVLRPRPSARDRVSGNFSRFSSVGVGQGSAVT